MISDTLKHNDLINTPSDIPRFTLFGRLPIEIRIKIWEATLPGPRVINIREKRVKNRHPNFDSPYLTGAWNNVLALWSDSKAPSTLFACSESYHVASRFYVPSFAFPSSIPETYFNFHIDTLYLRFDTFVFGDENEFEFEFEFFLNELECMHTDDLGRVQNLAIRLDPVDVRVCCYQLAQILGWFGNIQKLTVVVGHFDQENDDQGDITFVEPINVTMTCHNYETSSPKPHTCHVQSKRYRNNLRKDPML
ncbi:hypothetical protein BJ875DRAFT_444147 [Amylocarpus encephaloides]|uniref:2EXR domain-containing protein n=1 Tax=Amylocarpus encephaloides TaxID=45428 RepID=A0A9P7YDB1_9HELO|nr:hypothetical protein BJ875DRAFT_444147 [Amylocarpus encephaloides]